MVQEADPVDPSEYVFRRVHVNNIKNGLSRGAFTPTGEDVDGLSFYRQALTTASEVKAAGRKAADEYRVVRIQVKDILALGLTIIPSPSNTPGHCVTPEFTIASYEQAGQKDKWVQVQRSLIGLSEFVD